MSDVDFTITADTDGFHFALGELAEAAAGLPYQAGRMALRFAIQNDLHLCAISEVSQAGTPDTPLTMVMIARPSMFLTDLIAACRAGEAAVREFVQRHGRLSPSSSFPPPDDSPGSDRGAGAA